RPLRERLARAAVSAILLRCHRGVVGVGFAAGGKRLAAVDSGDGRHGWDPHITMIELEVRSADARSARAAPGAPGDPRDEARGAATGHIENFPAFRYTDDNHSKEGRHAREAGSCAFRLKGSPAGAGNVFCSGTFLSRWRAARRSSS